jgi:signal peptidase I
MPKRNLQQPKPENLWIEGLKTVGLSLFLAFGIRAGVAQSFFIPSGSMEPTLEVDDRLMVDKLSYRFQAPQRGDIIVFQPPPAAISACGLPSNSQDSFIKRIVGLPGERVAVKAGQVYINDRPLAENYIASKPDYEQSVRVIPPNFYLVLGDNRNNSCDGHEWGFVKRDRIIGKAIVRFYPFDRIGLFSRNRS